MQVDKQKKYGAFTLVMFMMQHRLPWHLYPAFAELISLLESKYNFKMHRSVKVAMEIATAMDAVLLRNLAAELKDKPFGLEFDSSTSIGNVQLLALVVSVPMHVCVDCKCRNMLDCLSLDIRVLLLSDDT